MRPNLCDQPNVIFRRVVNIGKLPDLRRCVTAARAAIPLVKQNALSALSSFARRLNKKKLREMFPTKTHTHTNKSREEAKKTNTFATHPV